MLEMLDISPEIVAYIITVVLAVLSIVLGGKYKIVKSKFSDLSCLAVELAEALKQTSEAIEDEYVTEDEAKLIVKQWKEVLKAGEKLLDDNGMIDDPLTSLS